MGCGVVTMLAQTWAQARLTSGRAPVPMAAEPVWAALFAVLLGGERFGPRMMVGGVLVLAAMYLVEARPTSLMPARLQKGRHRDSNLSDSSAAASRMLDVDAATAAHSEHDDGSVVAEAARPDA